MNDFIEGLKAQGKLDVILGPGRWKLDKNPFIISGPCSVESEDMIVDWSLKMRELGVDALRGGAFKPCTFPVTNAKNGWREGLREQGLRFLKTAKLESGLPIVSEIMDARQLTNDALDTIDIIQVGARNFQNYSLLDELGKTDRIILLKRGTWATLDEILGSLERIARGGNERLIICLRGVVGMPSYRHIFPTIRWAPDLMMISALKEVCDIPIVYDPSHATGYRNFVEPVSKAAIAMGADGLIVESHPDPPNSISDADQAISYDTLARIMKSLRCE